MNQENINASANEPNVPAQPPVVAVLTPQTSEENSPATTGCAAAHCSARALEMIGNTLLKMGGTFKIEDGYEITPKSPYSRGH